MSLIPDIVIDITPNELTNVCYTFADIYSRPVDRQTKANRSALEQVKEKFFKKMVAKQYETGRFKIKLKFYEAHFLEIWLISWNNFHENYEVQKIIEKLNQKLA